MKATKFINTKLNLSYREFVNQEFNFELVDSLFIGLQLSEVSNWRTYRIDKKIEIEFYGHQLPYKIINDKLIVEMPYPESIDDFISDCNRCFIDLNWSQSVIDQFDITDLMDQKEIESYYTKLLYKIDKD